METIAWEMLMQTGKLSSKGKLTIYKALRPHVKYTEVVDTGEWEEA